MLALMSGDVSAVGGAMVGIFAGMIIGSLIASIGVYATIIGSCFTMGMFLSC